VTSILSATVSLGLFLANFQVDGLWARTEAVWHFALIIFVFICIYQVKPGELSDRIAFAQQVAMEDKDLSSEEDVDKLGGVGLESRSNAK
jgi:hypothetical protein